MIQFVNESCEDVGNQFMNVSERVSSPHGNSNIWGIGLRNPIKV